MGIPLLTPLLIATVLVSSTVAFGPWGFVAGAAIVSVVMCLREATPVGRVVIVGCLLLILGAVVLWALGQRIHYHHQRCRMQMHWLADAFSAYQVDHGSLPPAYIADSQGEPMHSWRVLMLPYVDEQALYDRYDFDEPWNGPNNRKLADEVAWAYRCSGADDAMTMTNYVAVVGPRTVWPGAEGVGKQDIPDGAATTIMLVEVADADIHWMEPRDLTMEEALAEGDADTAAGISICHVHPNGPFLHDENLLFVITADGGLLELSQRPPTEALKAMLTRDGGESLAEEALAEAQDDKGRAVRWRCCGSCIVLLVATGCLLFHCRNPDATQP